MEINRIPRVWIIQVLFWKFIVKIGICIMAVGRTDGHILITEKLYWCKKNSHVLIWIYIKDVEIPANKEENVEKQIESMNVGK